MRVGDAVGNLYKVMVQCDLRHEADEVPPYLFRTRNLRHDYVYIYAAVR